jgi:iron(III) transport system substrate-binding protein
VNISGAGVTAGAPNRENALRLLEYLVSEDAQATFAEANSEYPVNATVRVSSLLAGWGPLPDRNGAPLAEMAPWYERAQRTFDEVGWR